MRTTEKWYSGMPGYVWIGICYVIMTAMAAGAALAAMFFNAFLRGLL